MDASERDKWLSGDDASLLKACRLDLFRASGHGGQKVNKTSSAARLTHLPSGVSASSQESRSQLENRQKALKRLRLRIALEVRGAAPAPSLDSPPSERNSLYPLFVAALFDALAAAGWDCKTASAALAASPSKLLKTLWKDPALWQEFQRKRAELSLPPLRGPG
jgi:hypothetical protein